MQTEFDPYRSGEREPCPALPPICPCCSPRSISLTALPPLPKPALPASNTCSPTTRSEEHTSELQSLMRNSYAVFCLQKQNMTHEYRKIRRPDRHYTVENIAAFSN